MTHNEAYNSLFYHHSSLGYIYLVVYVDNIIIIGSDQCGIQRLKQFLNCHFQTNDLGKLRYFLGIEVAQSKNDIAISQWNYALDILEETGMLNTRSIDTLMDPIVKLSPDQGEPLADSGKNRRLVRKLNYLTVTTLDISFPVSVVSQFLNPPYNSHWEAMV